MRKIIFTGFSIIILILIQSCYKQPYFADENASIIIWSSNDRINIGESTTINMIGYKDGENYLPDDTRVDLMIQNGTLSADHVLLEDGKASVTAIGDKFQGEMKITAVSGTVRSDPDPLIVEVGIPEVSNIITDVDPQFIPRGGGTVKITITIVDKFINPIKGCNVIVEANAGSLASDNNVLVTNELGKVIDYLTSNKTTNINIYAEDILKEITIKLGN